MKKYAIVLCNLGGPDKPESVQPFLFNLFYDKAIIRLPNPLRFLISSLISKKRAPIAQEIYAKLGGGSPLLPLTREQANALESRLQKHSSNEEWRVFIAMRYWHPFTKQTMADVCAYAPDEIIFLPLYPQFSTTTTGSSLALWKEEAKRQNLRAPMHYVGCYPQDEGFIAAHVALLHEYYQKMLHTTPIIPRILFSAHGLPKKVVEGGDPYQWQVEQTVARIVERLGIPELDVVTCYQSRVGPLEWIGPNTEEEIERAGKDGKPLIIVPVAFVSEHSETLVELDIEYAHKAKEHGVPVYMRVPALGTHPLYIEALAGLCIKAIELSKNNIGDCATPRLCPAEFGQCICY